MSQLKRLLLAAIVSAFLPTYTSADSIPFYAVNRAADIIDRAIEAHGGAEALQDIRTISQESRYTNYATYQSRKPGPPWDVNYNDNLYAVDLENEAVYTYNKGEGSGFITDAATLISPVENVNIDYRAGSITPIAQPDFNTVVGPFVRVTPPLLIRTLMNRRHTSHWLGEATVAGKTADIVTLVMEVGPALSLFFDRESGLLVQAERILPPFGQVVYRYTDYVETDKIAINQAFELTVNGEPNLSIELGSLAINEPVDKFFTAPETLSRSEALPPVPLTAQGLGDGVHLIGGSGTYALFVETGDEIVAVGGTAGIPDRVKLLREQGVDKPIRYGVMTHHHNDHILGVAPYANANATIVGHQSHSEVFQAASEQPFEFLGVDQHHRLGRGRNRVELYDIGPTPHVEHILVAYLPWHKLLFQADHSGIPRTGAPGPAQPAAVALFEAIKRLNLDVERIVSAHSPRVISLSEFEESVALAGAAD